MGTKKQQFDKGFFKAAHKGITNVKKNIFSVISLEEKKLDYILAAKIAGGHVILADSHGVGKTSLARALASSIDWQKERQTKDGILAKSFNRIQCTVDLLPQDILGFNRFDMENNKYNFNPGPIFGHFILCDEINLLTPKTQGSFFQAMEEQRVSIEGETFTLPFPFFIIATMNLRGQHLFPLPAPQLDRFMIQLSMGYPDEKNEMKIVEFHGKETSWNAFQTVAEIGELLAWQKLVDAVSINENVIHYIVKFVRASRKHPGVLTGLSPRAAIKMARIARALSLVRGDNYTSIDIVKELLEPVFSHRLELEDTSISPSEILQRIQKEIKI